MRFLVNMIGAGHLGKTIGHLLVKHQLVKIGAICNRSEISSINSINFIGEGKYYPTIAELPSADIHFITTSDDEISTACDELSKNSFVKKGSIVLHCSGSLTSASLIAMKEKGCYIASIHPMRSFAQPELSVSQYAGTYCAIEGDNEALPTLHFLFNAIGSIIYEIDKVKKSAYHAAGVFASNYLVTLATEALACMKEAGVSNERALQVITNIMQGTISNLANTLSPTHALTGPIKRGDISTIRKHIASLVDQEQKHLYVALGKATLHLTDHNTAKKNEIIKALTSDQISSV